jgi:hypothetical protein
VYLKTLPPQPLVTKADEIVDTKAVGTVEETTKFNTMVESQPAVVVSLRVYCPDVLIKVPPKLYGNWVLQTATLRVVVLL